MPVRPLHDARGFALLETLIAASILATALLSLMELIAIAIKATAEAGRTTDAALLAAQKIEELRAVSWSELQSGSDSPAVGFTRTWSVGTSGADPDYLAVMEVHVTTIGGQVRMVALKSRDDP